MHIELTPVGREPQALANGPVETAYTKEVET
jgi:hypothetical protein